MHIEITSRCCFLKVFCVQQSRTGNIQGCQVGAPPGTKAAPAGWVHWLGIWKILADSNTEALLRWILKKKEFKGIPGRFEKQRKAFPWISSQQLESILSFFIWNQSLFGYVLRPENATQITADYRTSLKFAFSQYQPNPVNT